MRFPQVTASTLGQANPSQVTASKPYRWRGLEDWTPNDPRFRETAKQGPPTAKTYERERKSAGGSAAP